MFRGWGWRKGQGGFLAIEAIIAVAITGLIGVGVSMAISQVVHIRTLSANSIILLKQVESAAYWLNHDAQMAQIVQPGGAAGFPLTLSWVEWDNTSGQATYTLSGGQLRRSYSVNGGEPAVTIVAERINVNAQKTNCQYSGGVFTFKVTASIGGSKPLSKTRSAEVIPRPAP